ncbi:MAG: hypothetical protein C5B56_10595 [Proteobacteria bacterium]|nr:MAG: hypothetical protein C5B56_10595 [Pseudomonadota bacterium]
MKKVIVGAGAGGLAVIALVTWFGARAIGAEVLDAAWAVPPAIALHAGQLLISAMAWRSLQGGARRLLEPSLGGWTRIRWIREAVNSMLPVAQLGGNLVGIRLLTQCGVPGTLAGAATTLDVTVEAITQLVFTLMGIAALPATAGIGAETLWLAGGIALTGLSLAGFMLAQRAGLLRLVEAIAERLQPFVPGLSVDAVRGLHAELMRLNRDRSALTQAIILHQMAWVIGTVETMLALAAMGRYPGLGGALAIESLGMAARSVGFVVPGSLGVQEGGFILVGGMFGLPPDAAIALSMVKRTRELAVGVTGLVAWQWVEGRRLVRRAAASANR